MYRYFNDKKTLKELRLACDGLMTELQQELRCLGMVTQISLVGSMGRNMVTQNENEPIDLDYNLIINKTDFKGRDIKEQVRKSFNKVLRRHELSDVQDSTSALTTKGIELIDEKVVFSIDVAIVTQDENGYWYRLIHKKTGNFDSDEYVWEKTPNSRNYSKKVKEIKNNTSCWNLVRNEYRELKNFYLRKNDYNHPSFVCYIEAVNNVYNYLKQTGVL